MELCGQPWPARTREAEQQQTERDAALGLGFFCGFGAGNFSGFVVYQHLTLRQVLGRERGSWLLAAMGLAHPCGQWCCFSLCVMHIHVGTGTPGNVWLACACPVVARGQSGQEHGC